MRYLKRLSDGFILNIKDSNLGPIPMCLWDMKNYEEVLTVPKPEPKIWVDRVAVFVSKGMNPISQTLGERAYNSWRESSKQYWERISDWVEVTMIERTDK